mmetsp:Transcript_1619/g.6234  ORF Transcript_1619/g.6234 Transcript_1619/m.6234 type:complete len:159 (-) Transcript_1619:1755-2231(-)
MDYGTRTLEVHDAAVSPAAGQVVVVDDILATGGSAAACVSVLRALGLDPVEVAVVSDFSDGDSVLGGKATLERDAGVAVFKLASFCTTGDMRWWRERGPDEDVVVSPHMGKIHKAPTKERKRSGVVCLTLAMFVDRALLSEPAPCAMCIDRCGLAVCA